MSSGYYDNSGVWRWGDRPSDSLPVGATFATEPYVSQYSKPITCECGADKTYGASMAREAQFHSDWCPLSKIKSIQVDERVLPYIPI